MIGPQICQCQVFLDGHIGCRALQRVLEKAADLFAALVIGQHRNILAI